jgi:hypothetical protein
MTDTTIMASLLTERIEARMKATGKNPSAVALEAGLGRSSVRDIIVNDANPRIDTLRKLTGPLQCSLEYLTGDSDEPGDAPPEVAKKPRLLSKDGLIQLHANNRIAKQRIKRAWEVETGVFRPYGPDTEPRYRMVDPLISEEMSYMGYRYSMAEVRDTSLRDIHIEKGDLLTIAKKEYEPTPIRPGSLLYTSLVLKAPAWLSERAIRSVLLIDGEIVLRSHGNDDQYRDVRLSNDPVSIDEWEREKEKGGDFNMYATTEKHGLIVFGIVVRVLRNLVPPV